ncbi:thioredoxin family protein [Tateyamaria pelophila]|uniref:thioredoxin family protein n=1 Tax=Tateyamaria pelophila TaxID=328415 RepID=UPI001CBD31B7|nr:thioredoxin family protein [Tateyamaria pelophila]
MSAATPPICDFDWPAPDFALPGTDGKNHTRDAVRGPNGLLVMFICNHCPYVLAILDRLIRDAHALQAKGIGVAAICSNDAVAYPADSFENMVKMADTHAFPFPYLHDADQAVARSYGAACTPDFFGFNKDLGLQYRGRLDASKLDPPPNGQRRDLYEAMIQISETGRGPAYQIPSVGCSIKWRL